MTRESIKCMGIDSFFLKPIIPLFHRSNIPIWGEATNLCIILSLFFGHCVDKCIGLFDGGFHVPD